MEFDWDEHNSDKNQQKHKVSMQEAEKIFSSGLFLGPALSGSEERFAVIGKTDHDRILFVIYTIRSGKIRVISARDASRKERQRYEEKRKQNQKNSQI